MYIIMVMEVIKMVSIVTNKDVDFLSSTKIKTNFGSVLDDVKRKDIIVIRNGEPEAVMLSYEDYKRMEGLVEILEDLELEKVVASRLEKPEKTYTIDQAIRELDDDYEI